MILLSVCKRSRNMLTPEVSFPLDSQSDRINVIELKRSLTVQQKAAGAETTGEKNLDLCFMLHMNVFFQSTAHIKVCSRCAQD